MEERLNARPTATASHLPHRRTLYLGHQVSFQHDTDADVPLTKIERHRQLPLIRCCLETSGKGGRLPTRERHARTRLVHCAGLHQRRGPCLAERRRRRCLGIATRRRIHERRTCCRRRGHRGWQSVRIELPILRLSPLLLLHHLRLACHILTELHCRGRARDVGWLELSLLLPYGTRLRSRLLIDRSGLIYVCCDAAISILWVRSIRRLAATAHIVVEVVNVEDGLDTQEAMCAANQHVRARRTSRRSSRFLGACGMMLMRNVDGLPTCGDWNVGRHAGTYVRRQARP